MLTAVYAGSTGEIYDAPGYQALGCAGNTIIKIKAEDMIPLPPGGQLLYLPARSAIALKHGCQDVIDRQLLAVAAILPAGYTRTLLPAYQAQPEAPQLPLFGYTAVAFQRGQFMVAAIKSDDPEKWNPCNYPAKQLRQCIRNVKRDLSDNRIVNQLATCAEQWGCLTAQNLFYHRWEAGLPVSPTCNANCYGCISLQPAECCPAPQSRIDFVPTVAEVTAVAAYHLDTAPEAIISFGQGCEGEPSLAAAVIAPAIAAVRKRTLKGLINMNTNAGFTAGIREIVDAGLDTMRVSLNSANPSCYQAYYRSNYKLDDVAASIDYAKQHGVFVSLNLLLFPGLNDLETEISALQQFVVEHKIDMIQLRNLNVDPVAFWQFMQQPTGHAQGIRSMLARLQQAAPQLVIGSFSHYVGK